MVQNANGNNVEPGGMGRSTSNALQATNDAMYTMASAARAHTDAARAHEDAAACYPADSPHVASHMQAASDHQAMAKKIRTDCWPGRG